MATSNVDITTSPPTLRTGAGPGTRGHTLSSGGGGDYNVSSASPIRYQEGIRRNTGATKSAAGTQLNDSIGNLVKTFLGFSQNVDFLLLFGIINS